MCDPVKSGIGIDHITSYYTILEMWTELHIAKLGILARIVMITLQLMKRNVSTGIVLSWCRGRIHNDIY